MFTSVGQSLPATDIYYDAAGVQAVIDTSITAAKCGAPWVHPHERGHDAEDEEHEDAPEDAGETSPMQGAVGLS